MKRAAKSRYRTMMKPDQSVLVQVVKEPIGTKGARLTSNISIAGRYLVLLPNSSHRGVSRKIEDRNASRKAKKLIRSFEMPQDMGLICRTASASATPEMLIAEANDLLNNWQTIMDNSKKSQSPHSFMQNQISSNGLSLTAIDKRYDRILSTIMPPIKLAKTYMPAMPASTPCASNTTAIKCPCLKDLMWKEKSKRLFGAKFGFQAEVISILTEQKRCIPSMSTREEAIR